jgi:hypothetical protein
MVQCSTNVCQLAIAYNYTNLQRTTRDGASLVTSQVLARGLMSHAQLQTLLVHLALLACKGHLLDLAPLVRTTAGPTTALDNRFSGSGSVHAVYLLDPCVVTNRNSLLALAISEGIKPPKPPNDGWNTMALIDVDPRVTRRGKAPLDHEQPPPSACCIQD